MGVTKKRNVKEDEMTEMGKIFSAVVITTGNSIRPLLENLYFPLFEVWRLFYEQSCPLYF